MTDGFCCLGHDLTDLYFLTKSNFYLFSFSLSIFLFFFFDFFEQFDSAALGAAPAAKQRVTSPSTSAVQKAEIKLSSLSLLINNNHNNKENGKKKWKKLQEKCINQFRPRSRRGHRRHLRHLKKVRSFSGYRGSIHTLTRFINFKQEHG